MNKKIKAHPLMIGDKIKPFLFVLVLPLLKGLFQYILQKRVTGVLSLEIIAFLIILAIAIAQWRSFSLEISSGRIVIVSGVILKRCSYISIKNISSVNFIRNPIDICLGSVSCCVNTEAGGVGKADFKFKLRQRDAEALNRMIYNNDDWEKIRISPLKIAFWAATTSSAFSGLLIGTPVINRIGDLFGIALYGMLFDEITEVSSKFNTYMPPIVNTITLVFIIAYGVGFVYNFARNLRFSLKIGKSGVKIENGIIFRRNSTFKRKNVNNISIEQTLLMRLAGRASMQVYVGGYGGARSEKAVIAPCEKRNLIINTFLPVFKCISVNGEDIRPVRTKGSLRRFLWLPILFASATFITMLVLVLSFPYFDSFFIFVSSVILAIICYWAELCLFNYKRGKLCLGDNICAVGSKGFKTAEFYCEKTKIGNIKLRQTPADRRLDTCKVKLTVCSESAYNIWVRNLNKSAVVEKLSEIYEINIFE